MPKVNQYATANASDLTGPDPRSLGVTLRPHLKTAKSVDVAKRLNGGLAPPITVSTFAEAEVFFAAGFRAILYAIGIAPQKLARIHLRHASRSDRVRCAPTANY